MARMARVVLPDYPHHVTQRGVRRMTTFFQDEDYRVYKKTLFEACKRCGTQVWAYCLMPNHIHLILVPSSKDGLRGALGEAHRRYTRHVNFQQGWRGHLWQERFHSFPMDEDYLLATVRYVENNPVKAGIVNTASHWPWSSAQAHLCGRDDDLVQVQPMLDRVPDWAAFIESTASQEQYEAIRMHSRTGRPLGHAAFLHAAERLSGRRLRPGKPGPKPKPKDNFKAS